MPHGWKLWSQINILLFTQAVQKKVWLLASVWLRHEIFWKCRLRDHDLTLWTCILHVQDAHKNYTRAAKELNKVRANYGELEGMVAKLRSSLETTASSQGKDRSRIQDLSEEVSGFFVSSACTCLLYLYKKWSSVCTCLPVRNEWVWNRLCVCVHVYVCVCACNIFHLMMLEILLCVTEKEFQLYFSVVFRSWSWWRDRSRKMRYCYILFFALILGCAVCVCLSVSCLHVHATTKSWISGCTLLSVCLLLFLSFLSVPVSVFCAHSLVLKVSDQKKQGLCWHLFVCALVWSSTN